MVVSLHTCPSHALNSFQTPASCQPRPPTPHRPFSPPARFPPRTAPSRGRFRCRCSEPDSAASAESGGPSRPLRDLVDPSLPSPSGPRAPSPTLQKYIQADRNHQQECSVLSVWATNSWKPAGAFCPGPEMCRPLVGASHSAHLRTCCIQAVVGCAGVVVPAAPPQCWVSHKAV